MSASRVTRKRWHCPGFIPGKRELIFASITSSSRTTLLLEKPTGTSRGAIEDTLIRTNLEPVLTLSNSINGASAGESTVRARFTLNGEIYGNGWLGSTAIGVSSGKILS